MLRPASLNTIDYSTSGKRTIEKTAGQRQRKISQRTIKNGDDEDVISTVKTNNITKVLIKGKVQVEYVLEVEPAGTKEF